MRWGEVRKLNGTYAPFTVPLLTAPGMQTIIEEQADVLDEHFS